MLEVNNLSFKYRNGPDILKNLAFSVEDGKFMAILGNNGVGKSTMLKCCNKILTANTGSVLLDHEDLLTMTPKEIAKRAAFVAQTIPEMQMTVHDVVMLGRRPYMGWGFTEEDHRIVHGAMERLNISHLRGRFMHELSGGERQKVVLARALAQEPRLLLLDEPTSSLDIKNQYQVLQIIQSICKHSNITAIMAIHDLNLALRFCDRFLLLKDGTVYACGDKSIITRDALLDVYGVNAKAINLNDQDIVLVDK